jgi:hypothetical protein
MTVNRRGIVNQHFSGNLAGDSKQLNIAFEIGES